MIMILLTKEKIARIVKQNPSKYYVYGLCRNNGVLYYVGMGKNRRYLRHEAEANYQSSAGGNHLKNNITRKESLLGGILYVLFSLHPDRDFCSSLECQIIQHFGRVDIQTGILSNMTKGGEGMSGISEVTRSKLREARAKNQEQQTKKRAENRALLSKEERYERTRHLHEAKKTEKFRTAVSAGTLKMWRENKADILEKRAKTAEEKPRVVKEEIKKKRAASMKNHWSDEGKKTLHLLKSRDTLNSRSDEQIAEWRKKLSEASNSRWKKLSPDERIRTPEELAVIREKRRKTLAAKTPEQLAASAAKFAATIAAKKEKKRLEALVTQENQLN